MHHHYHLDTTLFEQCQTFVKCRQQGHRRSGIEHLARMAVESHHNRLQLLAAGHLKQACHKVAMPHVKAVEHTHRNGCFRC